MATPAQPVGQTVSLSRLVDKLDSGGRGLVYKPEDTMLGRLVALKVLPDEVVETSVSGALQARGTGCIRAEASQHLRYARIANQDDLWCIAREFVDGVTLKHMIMGSCT